MADTNSLRGDTVVETLVNMSSPEMRGETVTETFANITGEDPADDFIGAILAYTGASDDLRDATVIETIRNILEDSGSAEDVPNDVIGALLMLDGGGGGDSGNETLIAEAPMCSASDALSKPLLGATVYGKSVQSGTPSPSAQAPIKSVTTLKLSSYGSYLLNASEAYTEKNRGITITPSTEGWFAITGPSTAKSAGTIDMWGANGARIMPAGTYSMLVETEGTPFVPDKVRLQVYGSNSQGSNLNYFNNAGGYTFSYSEYIDRVSVHIASSSAGTEIDGRFRITLVPGAIVPSSYVPGQGSTIPIDLDVYGLRSLPDGTRDELAVDAEGHVTLVQRVGCDVLDGSESITTGSSDNRIWRVAPASTAYNTGAISDNLLCDRFERTTAGNASMANGTVKLTGTSTTAARFFYFRQTACATAAEFATWLASNHVNVIYRLAEPVTHDLGTVAMPTAQSPKLNVWAVTDVPTTLSVKYLAASE